MRSTLSTQSSSSSTCSHRVSNMGQTVPPPPSPTKDNRTHLQMNYRFVDIIKHVKAALHASAHVDQVEISDDVDGWYVTVRPHDAKHACPMEPLSSSQTEHVLMFAQQALSDAALQNKRTHVLGHAG